LTFVYLYSMQLFSADPKIFSKNYKIYFLSIKTLKNGPQKLLIIGPDPFISQPSPDHSPQPRIDFSYYEISGPDICYHTKFQLAKIFRTMKKMYFLNFCDIYELKNEKSSEGFRHFRKLKLCMVNNSDKSKVFC
jgi:hypothetical protein